MRLTTSPFRPSVVELSACLVPGPSRCLTLDSEVTCSGSDSSFFLATSFSKASSRPVLDAYRACCMYGTSCFEETVVGPRGRHAVLEEGLWVREMAKGAIEAVGLKRPRTGAVNSGLVLRNMALIVVSIVLCSESLERGQQRVLQVTMENCSEGALRKSDSHQALNYKICSIMISELLQLFHPVVPKLGVELWCQ